MTKKTLDYLRKESEGDYSSTESEYGTIRTLNATKQDFEALWEESEKQKGLLKDILSIMKWVVGGLFVFLVATSISLMLAHWELRSTNSSYRDAHDNYYNKLLEIKEEQINMKLKNKEELIKSQLENFLYEKKQDSHNNEVNKKLLELEKELINIKLELETEKS